MANQYPWTVELATEVLSNLYQQSGDRFQSYTSQFQHLTDSDQLFVQYAQGLDPEPLNLAHVFRRVPYSNPAVIRKRLTESVARGWLTLAADCAYRISSRGLDYVNGLVDLADECYSDLSQIEAQKLEQLAILLDRIDMGIANYAEVGQKHAWQIAHRLDRQQQNPLVRVRRRLIYLLAYWDDAHIAAWSSLSIDGYTWEAFSYIASEKASNAANLAKMLVFRNYDQAAYQAALDDLVARNWLAVAGNHYELTKQGQQVRDHVDNCTEYYFNAVIQSLPKKDLKQLKSLLKELAHSLKPSPVIA